MIEQIADQRSGIDRRVRRMSLYFPDRRRGFVRRQIHGSGARAAYNRTLANYRSSPRAIATVLLTIAILNFVDMALTLRALQLGAAELNPIMAALIDLDPLLATAFKASIVFGVVAVMWAMRRYRQVLEASLVLMGGFMVLITYSLIGLLSLS